MQADRATVIELARRLVEAARRIGLDDEELIRLVGSTTRADRDGDDHISLSSP
ncbi:hypothetical protein ACVGVM_01685 [Pseudonocardia bannensis]|uniref:hypothetical protein n=1 Tax=Pseudonocardia bannensis TaxID=630973 RepID=UPI001B7D1559|nr:hypothetical protein [Pseudonocardia bannensis]